MIGPQARIILAVVLSLCITVACVLSFIGGYRVRDARADVQAAQAAMQQQAFRADVAEAARSTDHANAQAATAAERQRMGETAQSDIQFRVITREVVKYVVANPDPAGCDLDGDGLRAWRAANAGRFTPEPVDSGGSAGVVSGGTTTAAQRGAQ